MNSPSRAKGSRLKAVVWSDNSGCRCNLNFAGASSKTASLAFVWIVAARLFASVSVCGKHWVRCKDGFSFGFRVSRCVRGLRCGRHRDNFSLGVYVSLRSCILLRAVGRETRILSRCAAVRRSAEKTF